MVVEDQGLTDVFGVESFVEVGEDDDGEFEAFAFVDGHELDGVGGFLGDGVDFVFGLAEFVDGLQESGEVGRGLALKVAGDLEELLHLGLRVSPGGLAGQGFEVAGFGKDELDAFGDGVGSPGQFPALVVFQELAAFFLRFDQPCFALVGKVFLECLQLRRVVFGWVFVEAPERLPEVAFGLG